MSEQAAKIVLLMAQHNLRAYRVAKAMPCHVNAVQYWIDKIKRETGLDPKDFYDMMKLLPMAEEVLGEREK